MVRKETNESEEDIGQPVQILYCSRTHSQLTQFADELRRLRIPPNPIFADQDQASPDEAPVVEEIKQVSLGSRKNLCINPKVTSLRSATAINERCLELQQGKTKEGSRCTFLPNEEKKPLVHQFRDHALAQIRDIEDLASLGRQIGICPYYASRAAIKPSEVRPLRSNDAEPAETGRSSLYPIPCSFRSRRGRLSACPSRATS